MKTNYRSVFLVLCRNLILHLTPAAVAHRVNTFRNLNRSYLDPEMPLLTEFLKLRGSKAVAFDVGANLGLYTELFALSGAKVIAFEPQESLCDYLRKVLPRNITIHNTLLSSTRGSAILRIPYIAKFLGPIGRLDALATMHSSNDFGDNQIRGVYEKTVPVNCLDDYVGSIDQLDLVKIDVEGHELEVLQGGLGLLTKFKPLIFVEIAEVNGANFTEIVELLSRLEYELFQFEPISCQLTKIVSKPDLSKNGQFDPHNFNFLALSVHGDTSQCFLDAIDQYQMSQRNL